MIIGYFKSKKDKFIQKNIFKLIQHDYLFLFCLCLSQKLRRFLICFVLFFVVFWGGIFLGGGGGWFFIWF